MKRSKTRTIISRIMCAVMLATLILPLSACGEVPAPTAKPNPDYVFVGKSVNWSNRVKSYLWGTKNADLQKGGAANIGHIRIQEDKFPEVIVNFNLPNELKEVRCLGIIHNRLGFVEPEGQKLDNRSHTFDFNAIRENSGIIAFRATATNNEVGYFSITFERVQNLNPSGPTIGPAAPSGGMPSQGTTLNSVPSKYHGTYEGNSRYGKGKVIINASKVDFSLVLAEIDINLLGDADSITTISANNGSFAMIKETPWGEVWMRVAVTVMKNGWPNLLSMDININSVGLVVSNVQSNFTSSNAAAAITYVKPGASDNQGNWVTINWVTVRAFTSTAALGEVTGSGRYMEGETVELTATAEDGSSFEGWYTESGSLYSNNNTIIFSASVDMELEARFIEDESTFVEPQLVNIIAIAGQGGTVNGGGMFSVGDRVSIQAEPSSGYTFSGWYNANGQFEYSDMFYSFIAESDLVMEARFTQNMPIYVESQLVNITVTAGYGGATNGGGTFNRGDRVAVWAEPNYGYTFVGFFDEQGWLISSQQSYSFVAECNRILEARFTQNATVLVEPQPVLQPHINIRASSGGRIGFNMWWEVIDGDIDIHNGNIGTWATYTVGQGLETCVFAVEADNAQFVGWYENGQLISTNSYLSFTATHNRDLEARFSLASPPITQLQPQQQIVTISTFADYGGAIYGGGTFNKGDWATVWVEPYYGYSFVGFFDENGWLISSEGSYSFVAEHDRTLNARFTYTTPATIEPQPVIIPPSVPNLNTASWWAREGIQSAFEKGFVPADIQNNYTNIITRQEFCRMLIKCMEFNLGRDIDSILYEKGVFRNPYAFTDTNDPDILAAYALGIANGTGNNMFTPNGQFTREQAATMILNAYKAADMDVSNVMSAGFADIGTASSWAVEGISFVRHFGIMQGTGNNKFDPKATYTREQSIITLDNIK